MTHKHILFESVVEWNHLPVSEELFRRKHQEPLVEFRKEVNALIKDVHSYLSFVDDVSKRDVKSEQERVSNSKKVLHQAKLESERIRNEIDQISNQNNEIKDSFEGMNDRVKAFQLEASELTQLKKAFFAEVKNTYKAFLQAKCYYKDNLKMYFTIEGTPDAEDILVVLEFFTSKKRSHPDHIITIARTKSNNKYRSLFDTKRAKIRISIKDILVVLEFFTSKKRSHPDHIITIARTKSNNKYRLIDMKPKLAIFPQLNKRLDETNDISGCLCCIRKCLLKVGRTKYNISN